VLEPHGRTFSEARQSLIAVVAGARAAAHEA
jgi:hypothetical protein